MGNRLKGAEAWLRESRLRVENWFKRYWRRLIPLLVLNIVYFVAVIDFFDGALWPLLLLNITALPFFGPKEYKLWLTLILFIDIVYVMGVYGFHKGRVWPFFVVLLPLLIVLVLLAFTRVEAEDS